MDDLTVRLAERLKLEHSYALNPDYNVEIKQEQECVEILPEDIKSLKTEIDLDILVKSENQSCMDCENTRDNLLSENEQFLKKPPNVKAVQRSETLECKYNCGVEENLVNNIDYDHEIPGHLVPFKRKRGYESASNTLAKESEIRENALGEKILAQQKLLDKSKGDNGTLQNGVKTDSIQLKWVATNMSTNETRIQKTLDNRQESSKNGMIFKCHCCDYKTIRKQDMQRHILKFHKQENAMIYAHNLIKAQGKSIFKSTQADNLHALLRLCNKQRAIHKCPDCEKPLNTRKKFDNHLLKYHDNLQHLMLNKIHYCKFCTYKSIYEPCVTRHIAYRHNGNEEGKFKCLKCGYFALQKDTLKQHSLVHSDLKPYLCILCKRKFIRKNALDSHILNNHKGNKDLLKTITNKIHQVLQSKFAGSTGTFRFI